MPKYEISFDRGETWLGHDCIAEWVANNANGNEAIRQMRHGMTARWPGGMWTREVPRSPETEMRTSGARTLFELEQETNA